MRYFVCEWYNRLEQNEIKTTSNTVLWHIASTERVKEVFNMVGLYGAQVFDKNNKLIQYSFCGKVIILKVITGREMRGYILEEAPRWKAQHTTNPVIYIMPSTYNNDTDMWMFEDSYVYINCVAYRIEVYIPICILLSKRGALLYTTHRHVYEIGPYTQNRPEIEVGCCS